MSKQADTTVCDCGFPHDDIEKSADAKIAATIADGEGASEA